MGSRDATECERPGQRWSSVGFELVHRQEAGILLDHRVQGSSVRSPLYLVRDRRQPAGIVGWKEFGDVLGDYSLRYEGNGTAEAYCASDLTRINKNDLV